VGVSERIGRDLPALPALLPHVSAVWESTSELAASLRERGLDPGESELGRGLHRLGCTGERAAMDRLASDLATRDQDWRAL